MTPIKLIIIDDHQLFIDGLSALLEKENDIEVLVTFLDAEEALNAIENYDLELLITDISMPNMNGFEFIEKVKKKYPTLKILVISMFKQIISHKMIHGYLLKDASSEEFIKAIREITVEGNRYFRNTSKTGVKEFLNRPLTKREKEIVLLIAAEKTVNEIAATLFLSRMTIETHKKNMPE